MNIFNTLIIIIIIHCLRQVGFMRQTGQPGESRGFARGFLISIPGSLIFNKIFCWQPLNLKPAALSPFFLPGWLIEIMLNYANW
ncbi:hypothetical protein D7S44_06680 [Pantoea piersonii]|nr:hypothetical protein D7S44_06680 [Pantoea piersonii]